MNDPRQWLVERLKSLPAVAALVAARVWPVIAPEGSALPYIVYQRIDSVPIAHAGGTTPDAFHRFQLDLYAATYDRVLALADAVRGNSAEKDPSGLAGWIDREGQLWQLETERDDIEPILAGTESPVAFHVMQDYLV